MVWVVAVCFLYTVWNHAVRFWAVFGNRIQNHSVHIDTIVYTLRLLPLILSPIFEHCLGMHSIFLNLPMDNKVRTCTKSTLHCVKCQPMRWLDSLRKSSTAKLRAWACLFKPNDKNNRQKFSIQGKNSGSGHYSGWH